MTLLWFGGFEGMDNGDAVNGVENSEGGYVTVAATGEAAYTTDYSATGYLSIKLNSDNGYVAFEYGDDEATVVIGAAMSFTGRPEHSTSDPQFWFRNAAGTRHCYLTIDNPGAGSDTTIRLYDNGNTLLATGTAYSMSYAANQFAYYEIKITIHATAGACQVRVNGTQVMNATGLDTYNSGNAGVGQCLIMAGQQSVYSCTYVDDVYILDTNGSAPYNDFLGPIKVECIKPNADGNHTDWTASAGDRYAAVDDPITGPGPDGDSTYIYSSTAAHNYTAAFENVSITDTIYAIAHNMCARFYDYTAADIKQLFRINTTDYEGDTFTLYDAYKWHRQIFTVNPDDSAAWEDADIDGIEAGVHLESITA
jgi:hypothetical protein